MANTLKLPVGIENFEEIRKLGFYYIDKTRLIEQLLQGWGKVTLFKRPRRFGKTLNMSMLRSFFEIGMDKSLFDGLYISGNKVLCDEPVSYTHLRICFMRNCMVTVSIRLKITVVPCAWRKKSRLWLDGQD